MRPDQKAASNAARLDWKELGCRFHTIHLPDHLAEEFKLKAKVSVGEYLIDLTTVGTAEQWGVMSNRNWPAAPTMGEVVDLQRSGTIPKNKVKRVHRFFERLQETGVLRSRAKRQDAETVDELAQLFASAYAYTYWCAAEWDLINYEIAKGKKA